MNVIGCISLCLGILAITLVAAYDVSKGTFYTLTCGLPIFLASFLIHVFI